ncbi:ATP-binding protein [Granulicella cerasi]|uniref:histidine kinase n=1 Tax=Granulicella cerasi TaxID=741063 RepID=A0ABW1Z9P4_9BACT|nr:ATP-binding protein [Granulicella cerasi]
MRRFVSSKPKTLGMGLVLVAAIALLEQHTGSDYSLEIVYVFPVMLAAVVLTRWQIVGAAIFCAIVRGFSISGETFLGHLLSFGMASMAYIGCGLLIYQILDSRRSLLEHNARIRFEQRLRRRAEEQLRLMAQSSPAAILTISVKGEVLAANAAAEEIFALEGKKDGRILVGRQIRELVPLFDDALRLPEEISGVRTQVSTWAHRSDGTQFPATAWFSIYGTGENRRLATILTDSSTEVREREHAHFEDMVQQNRVLAGAVSHEIRNLCAAIAVVQRNLSNHTNLAGDEDFEALTRLIDGLTEISTFDLRNQSRAALSAVSLHEVIEQLRVVIGQDWEDIDGSLEFRVPRSFPAVQAERQGLLQVLLNLAQNSLRAVEEMPERKLIIEATHDGSVVTMFVTDTGHGLKNPKGLFQPFQTGRPQGGGSGLGLYVSRAIAKSFGADLHYRPTDEGCRFAIILRLVTPQEGAVAALSAASA